MKKINKIWICPLIIFGILMLIMRCKKDETNKIDPIITWENPADIGYGTVLSTRQLNATANVPGIFNYTPPVGTQLNLGTNQDLRVDFTPEDAATYYNESKTVKINVVHVINSGGVSSTVFNPNKTYGSMTDQDGNVYKTIVIGTQTWMAENLRTTLYRNGELILNAPDKTAWVVMSTPEYCNYEYTTNKDIIATYGRYYNWYAVSDSRNIAPNGWHVPTSAEWDTLISFLGGYNVAGGKLKEVGATHWGILNSGTSNESGFSALPAGYCGGADGNFSIGYTCRIYSSTEFSNIWCLHIFMTDTDSIAIIQRESKHHGYSVRCVKD